MAGRIAIVCAMPQEIKPLVRKWRKVQERGLTFFEGDKAVAVAGGIGSAPAAMAAMTLIAREQPSCVMTVGLAGALRRDLHVGDVLWPRTIVNSATGKRFISGWGRSEGTLLSGRTIASAERKQQLREEFAADAIDMESAGVASIADSCGLPFYAVKAISDEVDFAIPPMNEFVDAEGKFHMAAFALKLAFQPKWWGPMRILARNGQRASVELCSELEHQIEQIAKLHAGALTPQA